jgi:hypothetical protein
MSPEEKSVEPEQSDSLEAPMPSAQTENNTPVQPASTGPRVSASPLDAAANPSPISPRRRSKFLLLSLAITVLLTATASAMWQQSHQATPDEVFTGAITKLMSTKTVTQSASSSTISQSFAYDGSNIKDPRVSISVALKSSGLVNKLSGYGTLKDEYLKYTSFGSSAIDDKVPTLVNKWIQLRKDGATLKDVDAESEGLVDPRVLAYGDLMMGNFSASDRQKLVNYVTTNKVYKYDTKKVTTSTVNGDKVYVYPVTENIVKLKELNKKVAAIMGVSPTDIKAALDQLGTSGTTKLYIDIHNKQVVKYTSTQDGNTITGAYTDYDTTSLPTEPKADMTWDEFIQEESDVLNKLSTNANATSGGTSNATQQQI